MEPLKSRSRLGEAEPRNGGSILLRVALHVLSQPGPRRGLQVGTAAAGRHRGET